MGFEVHHRTCQWVKHLGKELRNAVAVHLRAQQHGVDKVLFRLPHANGLSLYVRHWHAT